MWLLALEKINSLIGILEINSDDLPPILDERLTTPRESIFRGFRGHDHPFYWFLVLVVLVLLIVLWRRHPID